MYIFINPVGKHLDQNFKKRNKIMDYFQGGYLSFNSFVALFSQYSTNIY